MGLSILRGYLGDFRTLLTGGTAGVLQLMYPPLGAAVAAQSDFFADPFGRVYRSVPQIWATVLSPDGAERARKIRDLHRSIQGKDEKGRPYHALDPETYWWAHATFTWEVFEAIRLFFPGGLSRVDVERLYAETVEWYELYGVSSRPVPPDYRAFCAKLDEIYATRLEMTPAAARTLEMALAGEWRPPLIRSNFRDPLSKGAGRALVIGALPRLVRRRFGVPWTRWDERRFQLVCGVIRQGFRYVPRPVHRRALSLGLRYVGVSTKRERFVPPEPRA